MDYNQGLIKLNEAHHSIDEVTCSLVSVRLGRPAWQRVIEQLEAAMWHLGEGMNALEKLPNDTEDRKS